MPGPAKIMAGNWRWFICGLLFLATTLNYMDRQVLGLLAPELQRAIGWSETQYAHIIVAFQAAYALGLLAFGRIIDRLGTRRGYALAVVLWSVAAAGHALAASVTGFGVARFALGLGEAGNFPAAIKAVAEWFPQRERALANGLFNSGCNIGAILAPLLVPWLALRGGWPLPFIILGAAGFIWLFAWLHWYQPPALTPQLTPAERAHIAAGAAAEPAGRIRCRQLLRHRATWAFITGYALTAPIWWFYLYWLPKFLNQRFGLNLLQLGGPLILIYVLASLGSIGRGWLSSGLLRRGWSLNAARKTAMLGCAVCVLPVSAVTLTDQVWVAAALIGLAASAHQGWAANLFALATDLFPKPAVASVVGLGGMAGALTAMAFAESTGFILAHSGSYWILFVIASMAYLAAWGIIHGLIPRWQPVAATDDL